MTDQYDHAEFLDRLEAERDNRALERVIQDRGENTIVVVTLYPDEDDFLLENYGQWKNRPGEYRVDRKERLLLGESISQEYKYITRSEKRALALALKRAAKDGFELDEDSDHVAEYFIERDGNYTTVEFDGYQILARDVYVYHRFDSHNELRYCEANYVNSWPKGTQPSADDIACVLADHHRLEQYCNDEWCPAYATITVYVRGEEVEIPESAVGSFESDDPDWLENALANLDLDKARAAYQPKVSEP